MDAVIVSFRKMSMKPGFVLILLFLSLQVFGQKIPKGYYEGTFKMPAGNPAVFSINHLRIYIGDDLSVKYSARIKFGPPSKNGDYVKMTGKFDGQIAGNVLSLEGPAQVEMLYFARSASREVATKVTAEVSNSNPPSIRGTMAVGNSVSDDTGLSPVFSFSCQYTGEELTDGLLLTFPLGESPSVLDKGWLFGARCILDAGTDKERDLTARIEWSGSGSFSPGTGAESRADFVAPGKNTIVLKVRDGESELMKEFSIHAVPSAKYAHVGSTAMCPADVHGCPGCPHPVVGQVFTGSTDVLIDGLPVACVGDSGLHSACCGVNRFVISEGDDQVLLHGKPIATLGSKTTHCGGTGSIVHNTISNRLALLSASNSVKFSQAGTSVTGDKLNLQSMKIETGEKGLCVLQAGPYAFFTLAPGSVLTVLDPFSDPPRVRLEKGMLSYTGSDLKHKDNIIIETEEATATPAGTAFTLSVQSQSALLAVSRGMVRFSSGSGELIVKASHAAISDPQGLRFQPSYDFQAETRNWSEIVKTAEKLILPESSDQAVPALGIRPLYLGLAGIAVILVLMIVWLLLARKKKQKNTIHTGPPPTPSAQTPLPTIPPIPKTPAVHNGTRFCSSCGNALRPTANFCPACGTKIEAK